MSEPAGISDRDAVRAQLERKPRSVIDVRSRCHLGFPVVIAVPPLLDDGTPFPTRYWLTCPLAIRRIGRIESHGGVKQAEAMLEVDAAAARRHAAATERYVAERDALIPEEAEYRPSGGVGGTALGVKCLHAHYADYAAGNDNPVGETTAAGVEPLDCAVGCVAVIDVAVRRNPDWKEPKA